MPTESPTAVQVTTPLAFVVSCASDGPAGLTWATLVSVTNPRAAEYAPLLPRSSTARTRQKYVSLYKPVTVSVANTPSTVSAKTTSENAVVFATSTAYESIPTLSGTADHRIGTDAACVSSPAAGAVRPPCPTDVASRRPRAAVVS